LSQIGGIEFDMKVKYENSIKYKVLQRLEDLQDDIVLRKDIEDLGSYRQVSRGLKSLIEDGVIARIGFGIYAKAYCSSYSDLVLINNGFDSACRNALDRLGISWEPGSAEQDYNEGKSTQLPVKNIVKLKKRFRGKINYLNRELIIEGKVNAK